ncbi:MAG: hypothetical protein WBO34_07915 [Gammaproteobacteria bacterium]
MSCVTESISPLADDGFNTEAEVADTMQTRRSFMKPDLLIAVTLLTGLGVLASTTAIAEESLFSNANLFRNAQLDDLRDGDVRMAGNQHTGLHLSARSQSQSVRYVGQHDGGKTSDAGVHMSWKLSW